MEGSVTGGHGTHYMYVPLQSAPLPDCPGLANDQDSKVSRLVPLMFAGMMFTIFDAVVTISNSINDNNNNNNDDNLNLQQSSNTAISGNVNVANQINVMNGMGRRKRQAKSMDPKIKSLAGHAINMMQDFVHLNENLNF